MIIECNVCVSFFNTVVVNSAGLISETIVNTPAECCLAFCKPDRFRMILSTDFGVKLIYEISFLTVCNELCIFLVCKLV